MLLLDELRFPNGSKVIDVPGGSGLYGQATLGARLFKSGSMASDVGCIVIAGNDLPESAVDLLKSWEMTLLLVRDADKPCTRGLLQYEDDAFGPAHLGESSLVFASSFHFLAVPEDLEIQVSMLLRMREELGVTERPLIVWEPAPLGCDSVNLASHLKACRLVDVFSPNRSELRYLIEGKTESEVEFSPSAVEAQARTFLEAGIGPNGDGLAIIRSGEHGVLTMSNNIKAEWFPAYYEKGATEVIDATGAGNTFVGAFAVAFQETKNRKEASLRAAVAASFALEQFGPPKLTASSGSSGELWNGTDVLSRLRDFKTRIYERDI
ncbi:hypothetical protein FHL15_005362 [Xylaria flabelliformis]|uniref:Carbohydrate kinase PfkB domain-containing protein n=1 Tax=Xylaria flabelliformis TaxID=2512241 RepID=A0A553I0G2_9PEZI|nr:hypothetical protein FHL15_005362 [Xylaria flabelliformis]